MATYIELTPSTITLTDSITGSLKNIKLHDGHLWLETTTGSYVQVLDNYTQDTEVNKPAAGTQGRWFYATDSSKLYYDNGTAWQEILNKTIYCLQDTEANKPAAGIQGRWFYATDSTKMYYDNGTTWQEILNKTIYFLQDTEANKPAASIQGRWFYATDSNILYYDDGTNWVSIRFKITKIDVTTTCQQVTITELDFNLYKRIEIQGFITNPSANVSTINLCCNGDTTFSNYYSEKLYASDTTIEAGRSNDAYISKIPTGKQAYFKTTCGYSPDNIFRCLSRDNIDNPSSIALHINAISGSNEITNITQLDLISDQADGIGEGSKILIKQG